MPDRKKVIKGLEICIDRVPGKYDCIECPYEIDGNYCEVNLAKDALELLKKQEAQKFLVDENGKITPIPIVFPNCPLKEQETVVRCKDCKHVCFCDTTEILPDIPVFAKCTLTDEVHGSDWFCADGERREDE